MMKPARRIMRKSIRGHIPSQAGEALPSGLAIDRLPLAVLAAGTTTQPPQSKSERNARLTTGATDAIVFLRMPELSVGVLDTAYYFLIVLAVSSLCASGLATFYLQQQRGDAPV